METQGDGEILIHSATGVGDERWAGRRVPRSAALITVTAAESTETTLIENVTELTPRATPRWRAGSGQRCSHRSGCGTASSA